MRLPKNLHVSMSLLVSLLLTLLGCTANSTSNNLRENSHIPTLVEVREDGLVGEFYRVDGKEKQPAIIALSGSDGSIATARILAKPFVELGYAVFVLSYWRAEGLPNTLEEIPLEYFNKAIDWLSARDEIDPNRIGLLGWSKGAEAALLVASQNHNIKAVLALSPSFAVWPGINFANPNTVYVLRTHIRNLFGKLML